MRDRWLILTGLLIFLALSATPLWYRGVAGKHALAPELPLPAGEKECVAPVSYMKTSHMQLLQQWQDQAVRQDRHSYVSHDGKIYQINLTGTCLQRCHVDKAAFCDRCHTYNGVAEPYCWDCHVDPRLTPPVSLPTKEAHTGDLDDR